MPSQTRTTATAAPRPNATQAKPQGGGTSGSNLLAQYERALLGGVGRGTGGNPLGDFAQGANAFWNASGNLREYGDRLRDEARDHERGMQSDQLRSQEAQTGMQTGAQTAAAQMQADAQRHSATTQADAQRHSATTQAEAQRDVAGIQAGADNFSALRQLEGIRAQTAGRVQEAEIGARTQVDVAGLQTGAQRYATDVQAGTEPYQWDAQRYLGELDSGTRRFLGDVDANTRRYTTDRETITNLMLGGIDASTRRYVQDSAASTQLRLGELDSNTRRYLGDTEARTQRYNTDSILRGTLEGYASSERIARGNQASETERTRLQLAGSLAMNQEDNYTARSGKFMDYMSNLAQSQWRAPDVNNIKYWG